METSDKHEVPTREWVDMSLKIALNDYVHKEYFEKVQGETRKEITSLKEESRKEFTAVKEKHHKEITSLKVLLKDCQAAKVNLKDYAKEIAALNKAIGSKVGWKVYCGFQVLVIGGLLAVIWRGFSQVLS